MFDYVVLQLIEPFYLGHKVSNLSFAFLNIDPVVINLLSDSAYSV